ncbi:hypothetical protein [Halosimplex halobium]|uniref:hypothetical protein n=1 Tax=Halosimplex halobium TaxID=3396618 RepID=UPI003F57AF47
MKRRQALKGLGAAGSLGFVGCSSPLGSSGVVLGRITVVNPSTTPATIRLAVEADDTLLDRRISLGPIDGDDGRARTTIAPTWSESRTEYTVWALYLDEDGERASASWEYTFTREDYERYYGDETADPGCIGAVVTVGGPSGSEYPPIGISPTRVADPCAASASE